MPPLRQVYSRKARAAPVVLAARDKLAARLESDLAETEAAAKKKFASGDHGSGVGLLNEHAYAAGEAATNAWRELWHELLVKFIDGRVTRDEPSDEVAYLPVPTPRRSPPYLHLCRACDVLYLSAYLYTHSYCILDRCAGVRVHQGIGRVR